MGRKHTFMDHEFRREDYDPYDQGDYITNLVFVAMAFSGQESDEIYSAIKDEYLMVHDEFNTYKNIIFS